MNIERIGAWEFREEPGRLSYQLTFSGFLTGMLVWLLSLGLMSTLLYASFTRPGVPLWASIACIGLFIGVLVAIFHTVQRYRHPLVLDRSTDRFMNGRGGFPLSSIDHLNITHSVTRSNPSGDPNVPTETHSNYRVEFILRDQRTFQTALNSGDAAIAEEYASRLADFLRVGVRRNYPFRV